MCVSGRPLGNHPRASSVEPVPPAARRPLVEEARERRLETEGA
jgi:hypothetical protein